MIAEVKFYSEVKSQPVWIHFGSDVNVLLKNEKDWFKTRKVRPKNGKDWVKKWKVQLKNRKDWLNKWEGLSQKKECPTQKNEKD